MESSDVVTFGGIRSEARIKWFMGTGRGAGYKNPYFNPALGKYELEWKELADEVLGGKQHICIFCSISSKTDSISDVLLDNRFDDFDLNNQDDATVLFRYYTRLYQEFYNLLIDLLDLVKLFDGGILTKVLEIPVNVDRGRFFKDAVAPELANFINYSNSTFKHTVGDRNQTHKLHQLNHHLPVLFEGISDTSNYNNPQSFTSFEKASDGNPRDSILLPSLPQIVDIACDSYKNTTDIIKKVRSEEEDYFKQFLTKYTRPLEDI